MVLPGRIFYAKKNSSGLFELQTGNDNPFRNITTWSDPETALVNLDTDNDLELVVAGLDGNRHGLKTYNKGTDNDNNVVYTEISEANDPFRMLRVEGGKPYFADVDGDGDKDLLLGIKDGTILYGLNINKEWLFFK